MRKRISSLLALLLVLCMCFGLAAPGSAAYIDVAADNQPVEEAETGENENALSSLIQQQFSGTYSQYEPDELVTIIVVMESEPLMDTELGAVVYSDNVGSGSWQLQARQSALLAEQQSVKEEIADLSDDVSLEESESYTLLLNAFTIQAPYGELAAIQATKGVKDAFVSGVFSIPELTPGNGMYTAYSSGMIGLPAASEAGYTGKGTLIAVLDTGMDFDHEAFANAPAGGRYTSTSMAQLITDNSALLKAKIVGGDYWAGFTYTDVKASDVWHSDKIVYAFDYADSDADATADLSTHGVHVAGIAAGHTVEVGEATFQGVAPDAQLAVMKVFDSYNGNCATSTLLSALEDCLILDVDVINMSLGTASGFTTDMSQLLSDVLERIESSGIVLAVAAGNDTDTAANNPTNEVGLAMANNPDHGIVSSPSTFGAAFSVASVDNTKMVTSYLLINDHKTLYSDSGEGSKSMAAKNASFDIVAVPGYGARDDYESIDVTGKIALIQRGGEISFNDKVATAANKGAVGAIIYNNEDGDTLLSMKIDNYFIPSVFISKADGEYAIAALQSGGATAHLSDTYTEVQDYATAGDMSSFSSWGTTSMLGIKPEITAPGGNIYSSVSGGQYASYSGTSMACPQIAGAAAVLIQYIEETEPEASKLERGLLAKALMMSTASPVLTDDGVPASVRQQGAGLVNIESAITTGAYLLGSDGGVPKAEAGSSATGSYSFSFTVRNTSEQAVSYKASANVLTPEAYTEGGRTYFSQSCADISSSAVLGMVAGDTGTLGDVNMDGAVDTTDARLILRHVNGVEELGQTALGYADADGDGAVTRSDSVRVLEYVADVKGRPDYALNDYTFTVPAGESMDVSVSVSLSSDQVATLCSDFPDGTFVEGFVTLEGVGDAVDLGLPYLGYLGDWSALNIFDSTVYDEVDAAVYDGYLVVANSYLEGSYMGYNYFTQEFNGDRVFFSPHVKDSDNEYEPASTFLYSELSLLRNAGSVTYTVADGSGNVLYKTEYGPAQRTYFVTSAQQFANIGDPTYALGYGDQTFEWPAEGETLTVTVTAVPEGETAAQSFTYPVVTIDETAPQIESQVAYSEEAGCFQLTLTMSDNYYLQGARLSGVQDMGYGFYDYVEMGFIHNDEFETTPAGGSIVEVIDLPEFQSKLAEKGCVTDRVCVELVDYAWNITTLDLTLEGENYTTEDKSDGSVSIVDYAGVGKTLEIPGELDGKTVTEIGADAFAGSGLSEITIPESIVKIGAGAFKGCEFSDVTIPKGVTEIGDKAFGYEADGSTKIADFKMRVYVGSAGAVYAAANGFAIEYIDDTGLVYTIADSKAAIVDYVGDGGALTVPAALQGADVVEIGYWAFAYNENLTSVVLPDTVTTIGNRAFMHSKISSVNIPENVTAILEGAFSWMPNLLAVEVPAGVTELPYMVFAQDWALETVTLNEGLETIGDDCFRVCTSLTAITLPDTVTQLGQACFYGCTALADVKLSALMTEIPYSAFNSTGFTQLVIPEGIKTIGVSAFGACAKLESVTLPKTLTLIEGDAFGECAKLAAVTFTEGGTDKLTIGQTFTMCTGLTSIVIPGRCTSIGMQAFYGCTGLADIQLNEGLESIGMMAFAGCTDKSVFVPRSVTSIGNKALGYKGWSGIVESFAIEGYTGTAAETYATNNSFTFVALDAAQD